MISHYALLMLLRIVGYISAAFPHVIRQKSGYILGRLLMTLSSSRVAITRDNIIKAFPDKDSTFHEEVLYGSYANLGIVLLEIAAMYFMSNQLIASKMTFTNITLIDDIMKRGKESSSYQAILLIGNILPLLQESMPVNHSCLWRRIREIPISMKQSQT